MYFDLFGWYILKYITHHSLYDSTVPLADAFIFLKLIIATASLFRYLQEVQTNLKKV